MLPETVARLAELDRIVGIKEATGDMRRAADVIAAAGDRITVVSGDDFTAFGLMALGGRGVMRHAAFSLPAGGAPPVDEDEREEDDLTRRRIVLAGDPHGGPGLGVQQGDDV